jgi:hypothetical protein
MSMRSGLKIPLAVTSSYVWPASCTVNGRRFVSLSGAGEK